MSFPENIFVLCTGRCGSTTLALACKHLTNFTSAHEGRTHLLGPDRLAYPPRHIEVDNRLSWFLGRLDQKFGDRAAYVHLLRDPEATAKSFAARTHHGIMEAYKSGIALRSKAKNAQATPIDFGRDYVDTVTSNIELFLRDKTHVMVMRLETLSADFDRFADWIGAEGNLAAARAELNIQHNPTKTKPQRKS